MLTGGDYVFSESEEFRNILSRAHRRGVDINNVEESSEFYQTFKSAKKSIEDFDSGQRLFKKIIPKYSFIGFGPLELIDSVKNYNKSKKQSDLESLFVKKGKDYTLGFLSNFYEMEGIFVTPFLRMQRNPMGLPDFSNITRWKNKINRRVPIKMDRG